MVMSSRNLCRGKQKNQHKTLLTCTWAPKYNRTVLKRLSMEAQMKRRCHGCQAEVELARRLWGDLSQSTLDSLVHLVRRFGISVSLGDVQYLDGRWYVTNSGLLRIAQQRKCFGLKTTLQTEDPNGMHRAPLIRSGKVNQERDNARISTNSLAGNTVPFWNTCSWWAAGGD